MKRGKDDDKSMGPMFPRLHVNDTEKGGPRAPPRNKMALYEQLTIPSHRFGSGNNLPLNSKSPTNMVPSASSSQGSGVERNKVFTRNGAPSTPTHWSENLQPRGEVKIRNAPAATTQLEQRKKVGDDNDDFMVPVFVQATNGRCQGGEAFSSVSSTRTRQPVERQNVYEKNPKQHNLMAATFIQDAESERRENVRANFQSGNHIVTSNREKSEGPLKKIKESSNMESIEHALSNFSRSCGSEAGLHQESRVGGPQLESGGQHDHLSKSARDAEGGNEFQPRSEPHCWVERSRSNEPENDSDHNSNSNRTSHCEIETVDKFDDGSETSMVDSISITDISPDDVVGIIGQKHFWKARRAIAKYELCVTRWKYECTLHMPLLLALEIDFFLFKENCCIFYGIITIKEYKLTANIKMAWRMALDNILTVDTESSYNRETSRRPRDSLSSHYFAQWHLVLGVILSRFGSAWFFPLTTGGPGAVRKTTGGIQQRVFAVQVFELHRLIKVQRLIAGSPNLMVENGDILEKSPLKGCYPAKKLQQEYVVVKPLPVIACSKDDSDKPNRKREFSAENAVGKESFFSVETTSHFMNYGPYLGYPQPVANMTDNGMGPWGFHQSAGPQWLVPVMSPSEGLVYKPYTGPGMMGAGFGGHGPPFGPCPVPTNFANSAYGIQHHQGVGVFPGNYPVGHPYYPPYGMPISNSGKSGSAVEEGSQLSEPGSNGETGQVPRAEVHSNTEQQGSCNLPTKKNVSIPKPRNSNDFQGSTASSPRGGRGGRTQENGSSHNAPRPPPPIAPVVPEVASFQPRLHHHHHHDTNQPIRVIKVVPHNARTATESAARIFRFIQQEREQFESI
ncbi:hypothetical protein G4B88_024768 [Cannabis sativa]|uniref:Early flowering 3 n=1 Tax=Cannabis sativa TaxID=3483 RepID=A0A7J6E3D4_CANSA|nr:hypothetical protein G4B88_024768 [Cannabis sativa]